MDWNSTPRLFPCSATPLAGAAFGANAACARTDDFVAAAHRTGDSHEDTAECNHHAVIMPIAIPAGSCSTGIARRIIRDHIDHLFVAGARQISYGPVQGFLFDFDNFFERQVRLRAVWR